MRRRIVRAAASQIRDEGLHGLTMGRVADKSGVHRQNIYRYFENKQDLLRAVLIENAFQLHEHRLLRRQIEGPVGPLLLAGLLDGHIAARDDELTIAALSGQLAGLTATLIRSDAALFAVETEFWRPLLTHGRSRRELRTDLTDAEIAGFFFRSQYMILRSPDLFSGVTDVKDYLERFVVAAVLRSDD